MTEEQKARIRSHKLDDPLVQQLLAGFLHQELRNIYDADIPPQNIERALAAYVRGLDRFLELAVRAASGQTLRDWESKTKH